MPFVLHMVRASPAFFFLSLFPGFPLSLLFSPLPCSPGLPISPTLFFPVPGTTHYRGLLYLYSLISRIPNFFDSRAYLGFLHFHTVSLPLHNLWSSPNYPNPQLLRSPSLSVSWSPRIITPCSISATPRFGRFFSALLPFSPLTLLPSHSPSHLSYYPSLSL